MKISFSLFFIFRYQKSNHFLHKFFVQSLFSYIIVPHLTLPDKILLTSLAFTRMKYLLYIYIFLTFDRLHLTWCLIKVSLNKRFYSKIKRAK